MTQDPSGDGYPQIHVGPLWQPSTAPRLLVTPNRLSFFASATALPSPKLLKLKNTGGGSLGPITLSTGTSSSWLDITQGATGITVGVRPGAAITRGSQCVNLTIAAAGAVGSPVTVPITLIADDSFPAPTAVESGVDGGTPSEAGVASEAGVGVDAETADAPVSILVIADAGGAVTIAVDASLDCDALSRPPADAGPGPLDGGVLVAPGKKDGGCGCSLGAPTAAAGPLAFALLGLALLVRRRRSADS